MKRWETKRKDASQLSVKLVAFHVAMSMLCLRRELRCPAVVSRQMFLRLPDSSCANGQDMTILDELMMPSRLSYWAGSLTIFEMYRCRKRFAEALARLCRVCNISHSLGLGLRIFPEQLCCGTANSRISFKHLHPTTDSC